MVSQKYEDGNIRQQLTSHFGADYDSRKISKIEKLEKIMHGQSDKLFMNAKAGEINGRELLNLTNDVHEKYFRIVGKIMGKEDYESYFKHPIDEIVKLGDPDIGARIDYTKYK